jgi:hypothetical protein
MNRLFTPLDTLLLSQQKLRGLNCAPKGRGAINSVSGQTPVSQSQYDKTFQPEDFVSLSRLSYFEYFINLLKVWPPSGNMCFVQLLSGLQKLYQAVIPNLNPTTDYYSRSRISAASKLLTVLISVGILFVPLYACSWTPGSQTLNSIIVFSAVLLYSTFISLFTDAEVQDLVMGIVT